MIRALIRALRTEAGAAPAPDRTPVAAAGRSLLSCGLLFFFVIGTAAAARANELLVDPRTVRMNDLVTITVSLEGSFAEADSVNVPLRNLAFVGEPSVSSEFAWMNGNVSRRKTFRFRVRPLAPGGATIGPVRLDAGDGQRETLSAVAVEVEAAQVSASNVPEGILRDLLATGRDPLFVVVEVDHPSVYQGEPVVVTWTLYNATTVQQWQIVNVPKTSDFWTEELPVRNETPERLYVGDTMMQRLPIRRAALFPLRSGPLHLEGLTIDASVMRPIRGGPFAMFEGDLVDTSFTSAPLAIDVKPLPEGKAADAIGELTLACSPPLQRNGGPVVIDVTLAGRGNLRAAIAPHFAASVAGATEVEERDVVISGDDPVSFRETRRWRYVIFPARGGTLTVPELTMTAFSPSTGERKELRCSAATIEATTALAPAAPKAAPPAPVEQRSLLPWIAVLAVALVIAIFAVPPIGRELALRRRVRDIVRGAGPREILARIEALPGLQPQVLLTERSERGEAYRALRSLLDAAERDRDVAEGSDAELRARIRDLLTIAR